MSDSGKYFCPRLLDYLVIAGCRNPNGSNHVSETPELLRRYPLEDHTDFPLPNDVIFFCQPEGCISVGPKSMSLREISSFVFTLTEKDSGLVRYGICINFYRTFEKRAHPPEPWPKIDKPSTGSGHSFEVLNSSEFERVRSPNKARKKTRVRNNTLTSLCVVSHHPFFSTFRECLFILQRLIEACHDRSCVKRVGGSKVAARDSVWGVLTGQVGDNISSLIMHEVREIETWILRLLSAPVPVPGKTRVEVHILPKELQQPLIFALPDNTRFSLVDFPLHLPLELLGVENCLKALSAIILEHKVILQSRDYNALTMSVMAFVSMLYPLEYMFPIIPLLPTCMSSAEQLLMAPTPYLIGVPASFFGYKKGFPLPDDVWLIDLDANKVLAPSTAEPLPPLPEPEGTVLKTHLRQALASMSMTPHPIKNLDAVAPYSELWQRKDNMSSGTGFNPLIYGNDVDSVDVATRVAMVRFFNSSNTLGNFAEHTRTLRLYPRPVVAFQLYSFLRSRPDKTAFTFKLARTQAVEYFSEWSLCPTNMVYQRVQTGVYDPSLIGDKAKWYAQQLQPKEFHVYDNSSSLGAAISSLMEKKSDDPTDESGSDSDGAESNSSSYSSLSDFVSDLFNSDIRGETPMFAPEMQIIAVDEAQVYSPPCRLLLPDMDITNNVSPVTFQQDNEICSSDSPKFSSSSEKNDKQEETVFRYDSGNMIDLTRSNTGVTTDQMQPGSPAGLSISPRSHVSSPSIYSQSPKTPPVMSGSSSPRIIPHAVNKSLTGHSGVRSPKGSLSSDSNTSTRKHGKNDNEKSPISSTIFSISGELAEFATNTMSELFGGSKSQPTSPHPRMSSAKPFSPLGHRKALVEKSSLVKHASNRRLKEPLRMTSIEAKASSNSENQQFLMEVINSVLDGKGIGWSKNGRYNKLMEDENYRNFVVSRLNRNMDNKVPEDASHIDDVCVYKPVLKGMVALIKGIIRGLGHAKENHGLGGMASAYMIMEIAHTHYWARDLSIKSDGCITPEKTSLHGSHDSLEPPNFRKSDDDSSSEWWRLDKQGSDSQSSSALTSPRSPPPPSSVVPMTANAVFAESIDLLSPHTDLGSPGTTDSENVDITSVSDDGGSGGSGKGQFQTGQHPRKKQQQTNNAGGNNQSQVTESRGDSRNSMSSLEWDTNVGQQQPGSVTCDITVTDAVPDSHGQGDMLREMVRNKELIRTGRMERKFNSEDSEMSEASTLISTKSEREGSGRRRYNVHHDSIRSALSDSEMETNWPAGSHNRRKGSSSIWNTKSTFSSGYRYHEGKLIHTGVAGLTAESAKSRTYLFEDLVGKDRSQIWDNMQFWEDVFLDSVSQERDIIGMDQRPSEMMERYSSLSDVERKKLEYDEDKLLSAMLYNQAAFMLMMRVPKIEIKKKIRRLLGKSHIGLLQSQDINNLLDSIQHLHGNDIDLKPLRGRPVQKPSFTIHWGLDNTADMLFMEVSEDSLILRNVTGAIHDRWWYEKLVNMTYCLDTKVFCLCRKKQNEVEINKFYTKKCSELYDATHRAMEKRAKGNPLSLSEIKQSPNGGEYPVQDLKTNESGILRVCLEGISLLLQNSQLFIELSRIQKCSTQKGVFVLEEFDRKTKKVIEHRFKSDMPEDICKAVLGKITYVIQTVGVDQRKQS